MGRSQENDKKISKFEEWFTSVFYPPPRTTLFPMEDPNPMGK